MIIIIENNQHNVNSWLYKKICLTRLLSRLKKAPRVLPAVPGVASLLAASADFIKVGTAPAPGSSFLATLACMPHAHFSSWVLSKHFSSKCAEHTAAPPPATHFCLVDVCPWAQRLRPTSSHLLRSTGSLGKLKTLTLSDGLFPHPPTEQCLGILWHK